MKTLQKTDVEYLMKETKWNTDGDCIEYVNGAYVSVSVLVEILRELYQACEQDKDCHGRCCDRIDKVFPSELLEVKP